MDNLLIKHGADVNLMTEYRETPLSIAVFEDEEIADCLIIHGANILIDKNKRGEAALFLTLQNIIIIAVINDFIN